MNWITTTTTYRPITFKKRIKLDCRSCGKKLIRVFSDYYTRNPFNKSTDHECRAKCYASIDSDIAQAKEKGVICRSCEKEAEERAALLKAQPTTDGSA